MTLLKDTDIVKDFGSWIVVNKPPGVSTHNKEDATNLIIELSKLGFKGFNPVHRLDKTTSGLIVLSKDSKTTSALQKAITETGNKLYHAIVRGSLKISAGKWDSELTNKAEGRKNAAGIKDNRLKCVTEYKVLKHNKFFTYLELKIKTGRQHQIRKHCVLAGHQVIGDPRYGDKKYNKLIERKYDFNNMALHAKALSFNFDGQSYSFNSPVSQEWELLSVDHV